MQTDTSAGNAGNSLSDRYPHLMAAFAAMPEGAAHLRRLQDLNATWQQMLGSGAARQYTEVVITEERPTLPAVDTFDIIYAGGGLNLLNAAVMTRRFGLRVLVFDRFTVGAVHREWNISRAELRELLAVGLLTPDELESVIQREYRDGLVRFHATAHPDTARRASSDRCVGRGRRRRKAHRAVHEENTGNTTRRSSPTSSCTTRPLPAAPCSLLQVSRSMSPVLAAKATATREGC